jgi:hypothetical protein
LNAITDQLRREAAVLCDIGAVYQRGVLIYDQVDLLSSAFGAEFYSSIPRLLCLHASEERQILGRNELPK